MTIQRYSYLLYHASLFTIINTLLTYSPKKSPATDSTRRGAMSYRENVRKGLRSDTVVAEQPEHLIRHRIEQMYKMLRSRGYVRERLYLVVASGGEGY